MDEYATHQAALIGAVMRTTGTVLELGAGDYSTPILHEICRAQSRLLVTADYNAEWLRKFSNLRSEKHVFSLVYNWDGYLMIDAPSLDVVFVDHSPGERRKLDLERLHHVKYVVVHDTDPNPVARYDMEPALSKYKYRRDFTQHKPWTTVVSDHLEIWK